MALNSNISILFSSPSLYAEKIDNKLLTIKIIYASESLREKVNVWISQISKGIGKILELAHTGIKQWQQIEVRDKYKQLQLNI